MNARLLETDVESTSARVERHGGQIGHYAKLA
jgi:hypothetical protein